MGRPDHRGDLVVVTMLREDVFAEPSIIALNKADGSVVWTAEDLAGIKHDWGSIRSSVAVVGDLLVYGSRTRIGSSPSTAPPANDVGRDNG